jgi:hypothetical protein
VRPKRFPCLWYIQRKPCTYLLLDLRHLGVPSGAPKAISETMVYLAQTVHLSCIEVNTISKQTEMIFHLIYATQEYPLVCP